jgi:hypothetical protein
MSHFTEVLNGNGFKQVVPCEWGKIYELWIMNGELWMVNDEWWMMNDEFFLRAQIGLGYSIIGTC